MSQDMSPMIQHILTGMDTCIGEQEAIVVEEREAMKIFDADALAALLERRARSQSVLNELESQCHLLCKKVQHLDASNNRMAYMIDHFAHDQADELQNIRIELVRRMQTLERDHVENHIRLRAAWNVTTNILQHVGAIEMKSTYANTSTVAQGAR